MNLETGGRRLVAVRHVIAKDKNNGVVVATSLLLICSLCSHQV